MSEVAQHQTGECQDCYRTVPTDDLCPTQVCRDCHGTEVGWSNCIREHVAAEFAQAVAAVERGAGGN